MLFFSEFITEDAASHAILQTEAQQRAERMRVYWTYVEGMLTNLGALRLERIHEILRTFVQAPNRFERSLEELRDFLALMMREGRLDLESDVYRLRND
jgi:anaphase-promoting complex subunit 2